jgi:autotransporter-associated beta strand protein
MGGPVVTIGNYSVPAGHPVVVPVAVTNTDAAGTDDIEGMTFTFQIANGIASLPSITSIDLITGSVWASGASAADVYQAHGAPQTQYDSLGILTDNQGEYINANGTLGTVAINTSGAAPGIYTLRMTGTLTAGDDSVFSTGIGATVPATFNLGQLTITAPSITWDNAGATGNGTAWDSIQQNFSDGTNPIVYAPGDLVTFNDTNNNHYTVNIPTAVSPVSITVNSTGNYSFTGAGGISGATPLTKSGTGTLTLNTPLTYTAATTVSAGKLSLQTNLTTSVISVASGATLQLQAGASINNDTLSLATGGTLDITSNSEAFNTNASGHSVPALYGLIQSANDHGKWDGTGITSSLIALHPGTAIGYKVSGITFTAKYTWLGDTDLGGVVNNTDLLAMSPTGTTWATGDFNYDGKVNADDYALFQLGAAESHGNNISTILPEPGAMTAMMACAVAILSRRQKSNKKPRTYVRNSEWS